MATINDPNTAANIAAVKAPSTAPLATDPSLVVAISPNTNVLNSRITGNAGGIVDAATAAAVPANVVAMGLRAATANPANAANATAVMAEGDKAGRQVITPVQIRELIGVQQTSVAVTAETVIVTAGGAGVFNDLISLVITTAGAAAQTITIKDASGGTTRIVLNYPNAGIAPQCPMVINFPVPMPQSGANANWTVTQSLASAVNYTAIFAKNL